MAMEQARSKLQVSLKQSVVDMRTSCTFQKKGEQKPMGPRTLRVVRAMERIETHAKRR